MKRTPLIRRTPLRAQGKSRFPKHRQPDFTAWLRRQPCAVAGREGIRDGHAPWVHRCFGTVEAAHVFRTRAQGVDDLGQCVPLCAGAHRLGGHNQEQHRHQFFGWYGLDRERLAETYAFRYLAEREMEAEP